MEDQGGVKTSKRGSKVKRLFLLGCLLAFGLKPTAQTPRSRPALQSLVDAERSFAQASETHGTRGAFLAFIAEDGILFRPTAVNGKKWLQEHPLPPSEKLPLLAWQPAYAGVALAGDMGYTFGPWEYKEDIKDENPVAYGHFATVWKRQSDGSWKFVIDHGISHPQPPRPATPWQLPANYKQKSWKSSTLDLESARKALLDSDRRFSNASSARGPTKAFLEYSAPGVRLFRNNNYPFVGADGIARALGKTAGILLTWQPLSGDVSQSEDLGYTHGTYTVSGNMEPQRVVERGNYMRIWKKHHGVWKIMVDVSDPVPAEVKN
jgi:ketosteroid isomerase-like protein